MTCAKQEREGKARRSVQTKPGISQKIVTIQCKTQHKAGESELHHVAQAWMYVQTKLVHTCYAKCKTRDVGITRKLKGIWEHERKLINVTLKRTYIYKSYCTPYKSYTTMRLQFSGMQRRIRERRRVNAIAHHINHRLWDVATIQWNAEMNQRAQESETDHELQMCIQYMLEKN